VIEGRERTLYGRRRGKKLRAGQEALLGTLLPKLLVKLPLSAPLFGKSGGDGEIWLEIGFGAGEHLVWQAEQRPDVMLLGCEPFINGVAKCLAHIERTGVTNVRLFNDDARLLMAALPERSLSRVFILFPDPWPKTRHHKRRFMQMDTFDQLERVKKRCAELRFASDDAGYVEWTLERLIAHPGFEWTATRSSDWQTRPADWPPTRYEAKLLHGKPAFLKFRRC
jgi:tRNA (guanine-N7-)-methyltransferase